MNKQFTKHIISVLLFGLNGIVASNVNLTSYKIVLLRTLLGSISLLIVFLLTRQKFSIKKHTKDFLYIALSGLAMGASWMFLYEAYAQIGVGIATLIYYSGPVIVMMLSPVIFKERLTVYKIAGFAAVILGVFLINGAGAQKLNVWGVLCGLLSAVTYSVMVMANKKSENIVGMENTVLQLLVSFFMVSVFVGIKEGGYSVNVTLQEWVWLGVLGIINTGVGCYFYFSSIADLPVQTVAVCGYLEPLSAVLFSMILLGERMDLGQIVGAVFIIGGAIFAEGFQYIVKKSK